MPANDPRLKLRGPWGYRDHGTDGEDRQMLLCADCHCLYTAGLTEPDHDADCSTARLEAVVGRLRVALDEALRYIEICADRDLVPSADGQGHRDACAALADLAELEASE